MRVSVSSGIRLESLAESLTQSPASSSSSPTHQRLSGGEHQGLVLLCIWDQGPGSPTPASSSFLRLPPWIHGL